MDHIWVQLHVHTDAVRKEIQCVQGIYSIWFHKLTGLHYNPICNTYSMVLIIQRKMVSGVLLQEKKSAVRYFRGLSVHWSLYNLSESDFSV